MKYLKSKFFKIYFIFIISKRLKNYDSWENTARKLMNLLSKVKDSEIFKKPVDPIDLGIPDYFNIVKDPMDFSTIKVNFIYI